MSTVKEITVAQTKPATEWVNGRALQKVSSQELHARVQTRMAAACSAWADATGSGRVGTEWEFRVTPPHEQTRPLVPDVAFLSYGRLAYERDDAAQIPYMAPDVAIEILSPDDRRSDVEEKTRVYLASGTALVLLINPLEQSFTSHCAQGTKHFSRRDTFTHEALPGFEIEVASVFAKAQPKRPC